MHMANLVSIRSTCLSRKVGCVLVNERNHVLSTGYNGSPSGLPNCIDIGCQAPGRVSGLGHDECVAVHAEENALIQCKDVFNIYACYTTTFPCSRCLRMLMNTSCTRIIYLSEYGDMAVQLCKWANSQKDRIAYRLSPGRLWL